MHGVNSIKGERLLQSSLAVLKELMHQYLMPESELNLFQMIGNVYTKPAPRIGHIKNGIQYIKSLKSGLSILGRFMASKNGKRLKINPPAAAKYNIFMFYLTRPVRDCEMALSTEDFFL